MSIDFVMYCRSNDDLDRSTDILGGLVDYEDVSRPIVVVFNIQNIHWNLVRVIRSPEPQLQLFEPMGKPASRREGLNYRLIPRSLITWLDRCCPRADGSSWLTVGISAITKQQQINSFDCGVACLLYAEKCGLGQVCLILINDDIYKRFIVERRNQ